MSVKNDILALLEQNRLSGNNSFISGEYIAAEMNVTRSAVWKAIKALESEGFVIEAVTNNGYRLAQDSCALSEPGIRKYLGERGKEIGIKIYKSVSSTNEIAKKEALDKGIRDTVFISEEQSAGRGRRGKSFYSPAGTGIYISFLLHPDCDPYLTSLLTTSAAVATARAIEAVSGRDAGIKWINDIWLDGKKVCGILSEASLSLESGGMDYAVIGIGVNLFMPHGGFPEEIRDIAACVFDSGEVPSDVRNRFCAELINNFLAFSDNIKERTFLNEYRKRLFVLGKNITVVDGERSYVARAVDIDSDCHLIVELPDKTKKTLFAGEISIRV